MLLYYYADFMKFYEIELFYENVQPDKKNTSFENKKKYANTFCSQRIIFEFNVAKSGKSMLR